MLESSPNPDQRTTLERRFLKVDLCQPVRCQMDIEVGILLIRRARVHSACPVKS